MAEANKKVEQAPAEPQTQPQPTPQKPAGGNKNVGMIVGIILVLVVGVAGYGYWNGSQVKAYAQKAEGYMEKVDDWENSLYDEADAEKINNEVDSIVAELNAKGAPAKAEALETDLKEYFSMAKDVLDVYDAFLVYTEAGEALTNAGTELYGIDYYDPSSVADSFKDAQENIDEQVEALEALEVPESMKDYNQQMIDLLKDLSDSFDGLIVAANSGDSDEFIEAASDLQDVMDSVYDMDTIEDSLVDEYGDIEEKEEELKGSIEEKISQLKNTSFVLF